MRHQDHSPHSNRISVSGHVVFLLVALVFLAGLYLYFQTAESVLLGSAGLILAHLAIAGGILYLLRGFLVQTIRNMHNPPAAQPHSHDDLQTDGLTISWAWAYDLLVKTLLFGGEQKMRSAIVDLAHLRPGERVLDVGCGTGSLAIAASLKSDPSVAVYGTDAAPEMIEKAREKAAKAGAHVDFRPGLVEAIDFPTGNFDVVMNSFMVHHLPGDLKQKAFGEILRVLKPGGRLLIVDFEPPKSAARRSLLSLLLGPRMLDIDNSQVPPLLQSAGFSAIETGRAGHDLATFISARKAA